MNETLQTLQVIISVLTAGASALLGFMFWTSSLTNASPFTAKFLKVLALISILKAWEVASSAYRSSRIVAECVPLDGLVVGLQGRFVELVGYFIMTWFLLRPETKKMLNGSGNS